MKDKLKSLMSSQKMDWTTPDDLFALIASAVGGFGFDAAANAKTSKCKKGFYFDEGDDALAGDVGSWSEAADGENIWLNPPYGRAIGKFVGRAAEEAEAGANIVLLIPARTDTAYFHDYIYNNQNTEILFLRGRIKFGQATSGAPFPSMLVFMRANADGLRLSVEDKNRLINFKETIKRNDI